MVRLTACGLASLAVVVGGALMIAVAGVPERLQMPILFTSIVIGLAGVACAFLPLLVGIRCAGCGRRIFEAPARPRCGRRVPIRFYCPTCGVEWDTGAWWGEE